MNASIRNRPAAEWVFLACGIWLIGLGFYFLLIRPPLLPEDLRNLGLGATPSDIQAILPGLQGWLRRVFTVMGGFMAAAGVLTACLAWTGLPGRAPATAIALAAAGIMGVVLMSGVNFVIDSDFKWLLLLPALAWALGLFLHLWRS